MIGGWIHETSEKLGLKKLYLFRYGILLLRGNAEHGHAPENEQTVVKLNEPVLEEEDKITQTRQNKLGRHHPGCFRTQPCITQRCGRKVVSQSKLNFFRGEVTFGPDKNDGGCTDGLKVERLFFHPFLRNARSIFAGCGAVCNPAD